jgi:hypothetical protein
MSSIWSWWVFAPTLVVCAIVVELARHRLKPTDILVGIPTKPARHSNKKPATRSEMKPAMVPI